jgi:hypothetical protein
MKKASVILAVILSVGSMAACNEQTAKVATVTSAKIVQAASHADGLQAADRALILTAAGALPPDVHFTAKSMTDRMLEEIQRADPTASINSGGTVKLGSGRTLDVAAFVAATSGATTAPVYVREQDR